jgi:hypothetical protein
VDGDDPDELRAMRPGGPAFRRSVGGLRGRFEGIGTAKDKRIRAAVLANLSNLYLYLGRLDRAGSLAHVSLKFAIENGLEGLEGQNYLFLAHLADKEGNVADFRTYVEKAKAVFGPEWHVGRKGTRGPLRGLLRPDRGRRAPLPRGVIDRLARGFRWRAGRHGPMRRGGGKARLKSDPPDSARGDRALNAPARITNPVTTRPISGKS